jgi:4-hydroxy-tetrahydrodipicolinate reductase
MLDLTKSLRYVCNRYERLVLRHEAVNSAEPYVYGTLLSARRVGSSIGLVKGWEEILEL